MRCWCDPPGTGHRDGSKPTYPEIWCKWTVSMSDRSRRPVWEPLKPDGARSGSTPLSMWLRRLPGRSCMRLLITLIRRGPQHWPIRSLRISKPGDGTSLRSAPTTATSSEPNSSVTPSATSTLRIGSSEPADLNPMGKSNGSTAPSSKSSTNLRSSATSNHPSAVYAATSPITSPTTTGNDPTTDDGTKAKHQQQSSNPTPNSTHPHDTHPSHQSRNATPSGEEQDAFDSDDVGGCVGPNAQPDT